MSFPSGPRLPIGRACLLALLLSDFRLLNLDWLAASSESRLFYGSTDRYQLTFDIPVNVRAAVERSLLLLIARTPFQCSPPAHDTTRHDTTEQNRSDHDMTYLSTALSVYSSACLSSESTDFFIEIRSAFPSYQLVKSS